MNKRVVIVNQSAGYLTIDIANAFVSQDYEVVIITGICQPMGRELNSTIRMQKMIKYNRSSFYLRLFTWIWGSIQVFLMLIVKYSDYKVLYTTNPPFACLSSLLLKRNFSIIIYDIYPDVLKNIGINEHNLIYKFWSNWNRKLFRKADKIITLSHGMEEKLREYMNGGKISVIANWSGSDKFVPLDKGINPFIEKHNLLDKFIVLYSGNIGYTHSVETVIEVAKILESEANICFLIIGEGRKKGQLIKMSRDYNLKNCLFMTWQPPDVLHYSLASADVAIVTISNENASLSVPSKTYNLLAVGSPLLCIAPPNSELALLVNQFNNGACFNKDQIKEIVQFILELSKNIDLQKKLSNNSHAASKHFTPANAMDYLL